MSRPMVSLLRDTDSAIQAAPFKDGQLAVGYDTERLFIDVTDGNEQQRRITIDKEQIRNQRNRGLFSLWIGTQAEYDAIANPSNTTIYITTDDGVDLSRRGFSITSELSNSDLIYSIQSEGSTSTPFIKFTVE